MRLWTSCAVRRGEMPSASFPRPGDMASHPLRSSPIGPSKSERGVHDRPHLPKRSRKHAQASTTGKIRQRVTTSCAPPPKISLGGRPPTAAYLCQRGGRPSLSQQQGARPAQTTKGSTPHQEPSPFHMRKFRAFRPRAASRPKRASRSTRRPRWPAPAHRAGAASGRCGCWNRSGRSCTDRWRRRPSS